MTLKTKISNLTENIMKKLFTLSVLLMLALSVDAQNYRKWDFTSWGSTTVANLAEEATKGVTEGAWSDVEKANGDNATNGNCYWSYSSANVGSNGELMANGMEIAETAGLVFNPAYVERRSLAIAVNYPSTSLGEYGGGQYLWLGGGNAKSVGARIACFTIPKVKIGQRISMTVESHKPSDARGVSLFVGSCNDDANQIGESFKPTTLDTYTWEAGWTLPEGVTDEDEDGYVDIVVYNTNGCHIYSIEVGTPAEKSKIAYLYNGDIATDVIYGAITASDEFTVDAIDVQTNSASLTQEGLATYGAVVISESIGTDYADALKNVMPWVPVLNLNSAMYAAWGLGTTVTNEMGFVKITQKGNSIFSGVEFIDDGEGTLALQLTGDGVNLDGIFAKDDVMALIMDTETPAIHAHNINHNGYLYLPFKAADVANIQLIISSIKALVNGKSEITPLKAPTFELTYHNMNTDVTIKAPATDAEIFYTLDGSTPTQESTKYDGTFNVTSETTVKAVAIAEGYTLSDVAEITVDLKAQAATPQIAMVPGDNNTTVTITCASEGTQIWYNYTGSNKKAESSEYTEPLSFTLSKTIYAFATSETLVQSEIDSCLIAIKNAEPRVDIIAHMDPTEEVYFEKGNKSSSKVSYYFSWGKDKSVYPYYIGEPTENIDPVTGEVSVVYSELNTEEETNFENGWAVRSRGQLSMWENTSPGRAFGDTSASNLASVDDDDANFPITKNQVNLADKNTTPANASFPYNAYIVSTQAFQGPFDIVAYIGNGTKPENESHLVVVLQTSKDGNAWENTWEVLGDSIHIINGGRLVKKYTRSYNGTDNVYVRAYLADKNSKAQFFDIYIANNGEKSAELKTANDAIYQNWLTGIEDVAFRKSTNAVATEIYNLNGMRISTAGKGLNIIKMSDGTTKKVIIK